MSKLFSNATWVQAGILTAALSFTSVIAHSSSANAAYKNVVKEHGINLSLAEHNGEYLVKSEIQATIKNAKVSKFKDAIFGLKTMPQWLNVKSATLVKRYNDKKQVASLVSDLPFPLSDRESLMVQQVVEMTPKRIRIKLTDASRSKQKHANAERVTPLSGEWILTQKGNHVHVILRSNFDAQLPTSLPQRLILSTLKSDARKVRNGISNLTL